LSIAVVNMDRLILTGLHGLGLGNTDLADMAIIFSFRFVSGPLPFPDQLASYLAARSDDHGPGRHWSDFVAGWPPAPSLARILDCSRSAKASKASNCGLIRTRTINCS
jgi:hypothetical protein